MTETKTPSALILDCETSGLYREDISIDDDRQPWCIQIGAGLCDDDGNMVQHMNFIVKANGRTVKEGAEAVHGITPGMADRIGIPEPRVLGILADMLKIARVRGLMVVTFSDFDKRVISSLFARFARDTKGSSSAYDRLWMARPGIQFVDLQKPWCQLACRIDSGFESGEFKWPSLDESARIILGREPREGRHNAFEDMLILKDLFVHFSRQGCFSGPEEDAA